MSIELYVFPPSPRAFRRRRSPIISEFYWTPHIIDLPKGEQKMLQYEAINPNMRNAHAQGRRLRAVAVRRDPAISRGEETRERAATQGRARRLDVTRWQFRTSRIGIRPAPSSRSNTWSNRSCCARASPTRRRSPRAPKLFHRAAKALDGQLKGKKFVDRRHADGGGFLARRTDEAGRHGALSARALRRDQALVRHAERAAGLAEDAGANRDAGRQRRRRSDDQIIGGMAQRKCRRAGKAATLLLGDINHSLAMPEDAFFHIRSVMPSPLKSAGRHHVPALGRRRAEQVGGAAGGRHQPLRWSRRSRRAATAGR